MKYVVAILLILVALVCVDTFIARKADYEIRRTNANLYARLSEVDLVLEGPSKQACVINRIHQFYAFQTCFFKGDDYFQFIYHKPKPLLVGIGLSRNSSYFQEWESGDLLATIREGVVVHERFIAIDQ